MANSYTAAMKQDADWRMGWVEEGFPVWPLILQSRKESEIGY